MTRLELAQQLFQYDPRTTPQRTLDEARRSIEQAERRLQREQQALAELEDDAIYEWRLNDTTQTFRATKREIAKRTAKQIRLAPEFRHTKQTYLPRQPMEAGEFVHHRPGWWEPDFAFGWVIRPKVEEQVASCSRALENARFDLWWVEDSIANNDIVLTRSQSDLFARFLRSFQGIVEPVEPEPVIVETNWQKEGF